MAETLQVLVKVAERKVEQAQHELAMTRRALAGIHGEMQACRDEVTRAFEEAGKVGMDMMAVAAATAFAERMKRKIGQLEALLHMLRANEEEQLALLHKLFIEQKRYELLMERQRKARRKEHAKRQQSNLDELGRAMGLK